MLATAVTRCIQKWSVPPLAEPRPRTLPSGVRWLMSEPSPERDAGRPQGRRQSQGADDGQPRESIRGARLQTPPGVPEQVAHAPQHVVDERPGVAEQHELAER